MRRGLMGKWIYELCYQVDDGGAARAGDETEGDGGDQSDGR